jgi:hypothetical protein
MLVGWLAALLVGLGVEFDSAAFELFLVSLLSGAWYALARWLEMKFPAFGWLLGYKSAPMYEGQHEAP